MSTQVEILLKDQIQITSKIAYAIPLKWWEQFSANNTDTQNIDSLQIPALNIRSNVDPFLFQYSSYITEQLQHKCNHLKFSQVFLSFQPLQKIQWKLVSSQIWKRISNKSKENEAIMVYYNKEDPKNWIKQKIMQIQIVFCSSSNSQAFIGYFPNTASTVQIIRDVGYQLGFIQMEQSRVMYPEKNHGAYHLQELQNIQLDAGLDTFIMAYNFEKTEIQATQVTFRMSQQQNASNQAVMGDLGMIANQSWEQVRNDRTMSTGAQTPSFLWSEEDAGFRVKQLFRQRKPEQVQQMKIYAEKCMQDETIQLSLFEETVMLQNLQGIAEEIIELSNMYKKKSPKEKEFFNE